MHVRSSLHRTRGAPEMRCRLPVSASLGDALRCGSLRMTFTVALDVAAGGRALPSLRHPERPKGRDTCAAPHTVPAVSPRRAGARGPNGVSLREVR